MVGRYRGLREAMLVRVLWKLDVPQGNAALSFRTSNAAGAAWFEK